MYKNPHHPNQKYKNPNKINKQNKSNMQNSSFNSQNQINKSYLSQNNSQYQNQYENENDNDNENSLYQNKNQNEDFQNQYQNQNFQNQNFYYQNQQFQPNKNKKNPEKFSYKQNNAEKQLKFILQNLKHPLHYEIENEYKNFVENLSDFLKNYVDSEIEVQQYGFYNINCPFITVPVQLTIVYPKIQNIKQQDELFLTEICQIIESQEFFLENFRADLKLQQKIPQIQLRSFKYQYTITIDLNNDHFTFNSYLYTYYLDLPKMIAQQQGSEIQENLDIYYQLFQLIFFLFQANELLDNDFRDLDRIFVMMVFFLKENKILPPLQHIQTQQQRELQKQKYNNKQQQKNNQEIDNFDNLTLEDKIYSKISYISVSPELINFQEDINEIMKYNNRFNYSPIQPPNITVFDLFEQFLKFYSFILGLNQQDRPVIQINTFKTQQNKNLNFLTIQDPLIRKIPLNFHTNKTQILTDLFQNFSYKLVNYNMAKLLSEQLDSIFNRDLCFDDEQVEEQLFKANNKINQIQQKIKQYFNIDTDEKVIQQNTVLNKNLENCKILHEKINANIVNVQDIDIQQFEETIQYLNELYKNLNDYYDLQKLQQQYLDESEQQEDFLIEYLDHLTRINDYYIKLQSQQDIIKFLNIQMQQQIKLHSSEVYQQLEKYNQIFQQNTGENLPNFELKKEKNEPKKQQFTYTKDESEYPQL